MIYTVLFFLLLLLASALCSATETAITSVNEISLASMTNKGVKRQKIVMELVKDKRSVIAAILVGNNIVNTVLAVYAGIFFDQIFVETGLLSASVGPMVASFITIVFLLIFGEIIPKHLGVTFAKAWTYMVAYPVWVAVLILKPITKIMDIFSRMLLRLLPFKGDSEDAPTIQELLLMAKFSEQAGHIDSFERKLMSKSSRFNDMYACDLMVPRNCVKGVPESIGMHDLIEVFRSDMYSRVPVYRGDIEEIVGVINFKELLKLDQTKPENFSASRIMLTPLFIPENVTLGELLEQMRASRTHMAVVIDEHGSTSGIITMEDIMERVFGLIGDEYDVENVQAVKKHENGEMEVAGNISLQELESALNVVFPEEARRQVNTLNGFLTYLKGDFPKKKEKITWKNFTFKVKELDGHRAERILIKRKD